MDVYILLIVLANLLFYVTSLTCVWLMRRRIRSLERDDFTLDRALREALIDETLSSEHRVDAATREAESGFHWCAVCEFANFKRFRYCALCGENISAMITTAPQLTPERASSRRSRARRRSEWTRKLDVEGRAFWFQSAVAGTTGGTATDPQLPNVVVQFSARTSGTESSGTRARGAAAAATLSKSSKTTSNDMPAVPAKNSAESIVGNSSRQLKLAAQCVELVLVRASDANACAFADGGDLGSRERVRETLEFANKDFPTKYAHFVVSTASLIVPAEVEFLKLSVHREFMLEESVDHLSCIQEANIRSFMRITFLDESGVDAGGVHREWFMLVNEMLLAPALRLFVCTNKSEQTFYLNPHSAHDVGEDHLAYYFSTGRLIGRALLEGGVWGFHLSLPLIKIILGIPVSFSDLEYFDPEAYRSMVWLLENSGVDALGLDFSVTEQRGDGEVVVVDLVPNGRDIAVTDANKREYLDRKLRHLLFESVSSQLYVFLKGLYEVIPQELLMLFDAEEFDYLLCGTQEIDVDDWRANTVISANLMLPKTLDWFWEVVREMPNEYRRRLLLFATGSSRVPLVGFKGLTSYDGRLCPFTLKGVPYTTSAYISSHACFNRLDLPLYTDRGELTRMLYATLDTEAYGFTIA